MAKSKLKLLQAAAADINEYLGWDPEIDTEAANVDYYKAELSEVVSELVNDISDTENPFTKEDYEGLAEDTRIILEELGFPGFPVVKAAAKKKVIPPVVEIVEPVVEKVVEKAKVKKEKKEVLSEPVVEAVKPAKKVVQTTIGFSPTVEPELIVTPKAKLSKKVEQSVISEPVIETEVAIEEQVIEDIKPITKPKKVKTQVVVEKKPRKVYEYDPNRQIKEESGKPRKEREKGPQNEAMMLVRRMVVENPNVTLNTIEAALHKNGFNQVKRNSIVVRRMEMRHALDLLKSLGKIV